MKDQYKNKKQLISEIEELRRRVAKLGVSETDQKPKVNSINGDRARLKHLISVSPAVIYSCEPSPSYAATFISENCLVQLGYDPAEFLEDSEFWADKIHPDDKDRVFSDLPILFKHGKHVHEYRFLHKNGSYIWLHDELILVNGANGNPLEIVGSMIDISKRKIADEKLRETIKQIAKKNKYETIISSISRSVHQSNDLDEVLENAVDSMHDNIDNVGHISIFLVEGTDAVLKADRNSPDWFLKRIKRVSYPKGFIWNVISNAKPRYCPDVENDDVIGPAGKKLGSKSYLGMPIFVKDKIVGVVCVHSYKINAFDDDELKLLDIVARQIETAINNAQQAEALQKAHYEMEIRVKDRTKELITANESLVMEMGERKRTEEAFQESEDRYRDIFDNAADLIQSVRIDGTFQYVNRAWLETLGYSEEDLKSLTLFDVIHPDCMDYCMSIYQRLLEGETVDTMEAVFKTKDGSRVIVEGHASCKFEDGKPVATRGIFHDITERKLAEDALKESERKYSALYENNPSMYFSVDDGLRVVSVNLFGAEALGYEIEELVGGNVLDVFHPDDRDALKAQLTDCIANPDTLNHGEFRTVNKDGHTIWVEEHVRSIIGTNGKPLVLISCADITERKRAQMKLASSQQNYEVLVNTVDGIVWEANPQTFHFTFISKQAERLLGYSVDQWYSNPSFWKDHLHPDDREWASNFCINAVSEKKDHVFEYRMIAADGRVVWLRDIVSVIIEDDNNVKLRGIIVDISESKVAEKELEKNERMLQRYLEFAPSGILIVDKKGNIELVNSQIERMFGYDREELLGKPVETLIPKRFHDNHSRDRDLYSKDPITRPMGIEKDLFAIRKDGSEFPVDISLSLVGTDENVLIMSSIIDLSERKRMEVELNRRNIDLEILNSIIQAMNESNHLEDIYEVALNRFVEQEFVDIVTIYLVDESANEAVLQVHRNLPEKFILRAGRIPYPKGLTWKIINTGEVLNVKNIKEDPDVGAVGREIGVRSMLGIPIALEGKIIGALWILSHTERRFDDREVKSLSSIGRQISIAVARAKLYEELSKKKRYEETVRVVTQSVHQSIDLDQVFENAVESMSVNLERVEHVSIYMVENNEAVMRTFRGFPDWFAKIVERIPYPKGYTWKVISEGKALYCADVDEDDMIGPAGKKVGIKSYLSMPIKMEEQTIGCINVHSFQKNAFDEDEINLIETVAKQIEVAINNARQTENLKLTQSAIDKVSDAMYWILPEGKFFNVNDAACNMLGYTREELLTMSVPDIDSDVSKEQWPLMWGKIKSEGRGRFEFHHKTKDGRIIPVEVVTNYMKFGDLEFTCSFVRDITERKLAEDKLRESEAQYRTLYEQSPVGICTIDKDYKITQCNSRMAEIFQSSYDRIIGLDLNTLKDKSFVPAVKKALEGEVNNIECLYEATTSGAKPWLYGSLAPFYDLDGNVVGVLCAVEDITDRKRMEEELQKTHNLESLGIFAGGIAHDFNNLLTAILGNISIAKIETSQDDKLFKRLSAMEKATLGARKLTQQLLTFAKGGTPVKETSDIKELLSDSINFVLRGSNVRCEYDLPDDLWHVEIDQGQINQVINNLIINAKQSMPSGGIVEVSAENIELSPDSNTPLKVGKYVKINIKDHGSGIHPEHLSKIFDPYFTTKTKGSGLGLSISYSVIKKHNGHIEVASNVGAGSTFTIYLPASNKPAPESTLPERILVAQKGRILLMDDEEIVRDVAYEMLQTIGYEAVTCDDGGKAIELYKEALTYERPFNAVVLDLTVPGGMGGKDTMKKLLEIDPEVKSIASSGYSNDPIMANYKEYGFSNVLAKPYKLEEIAYILRLVISLN